MRRKAITTAPSCDTESLVHLYEEEGVDFVRHLNGMFALAIWDRNRDRLVLARDRMGQKPLYYGALPGGGLAFGSEPKAVLSHPEISRALDAESLVRYLFYEYVPAPYSIWRSLRKLPCGHLLTWDRGEVRVRKYWSPPDLESIASGLRHHGRAVLESVSRLGSAPSSFGRTYRRFFVRRNRFLERRRRDLRGRAGAQRADLLDRL